MRKITDKALITVCCCMICGRSVLAVTALLTAITVSSVCQYAGKSKISFTFEICYALFCFINPAFLLMLPVVIYDMAEDKKIIPAFIAAFAFLSGLFKGNFHNTEAILIFSAVSYIFQSRTSSYEQLYESYIKTIDTSAEVNKLLKENNIRLIKNQNYEIRLATLNERNRIAREIHDNVGHLLSRSILQIQAMKLINDPELINEGLESLGESLGSAMTSVRQSVHDLHDDSIDLNISFRELIRPLKEKGIDIDYECQYISVPNDIKKCVIGILKEGISNMIRHSSADHAEIVFREHPAFYQLIIKDNGRCSEKIDENGIGLSNMKARVDELEGIINITSGQKGFRIFVSIRKKGSIYENNCG